MEFVKSLVLKNFRLDIVGFLTLLGDASVRKVAQYAVLTPAGFLPRLVPAPQALLSLERPRTLEAVKNITVINFTFGSVHSQLSQLAYALQDTEGIDGFAVKHIRVRTKDSDGSPGSTREPIRARIVSWSSLTWLAIISFANFLALVALSIYYDDGMALLGTLFLGLLSTLIQLGMYSTVESKAYRWRGLPLDHQIMIEYQRRIFVYVECDRMVARKLYAEPEKLSYLLPYMAYQWISLLGTFMLMGGIITLANAHIEMQIGYIMSYVLLNAAYLLVASMPGSKYWDRTTYFKVEEPYGQPIRTESFTQALWTAIAVSGSTKWIRLSQMAPENDSWYAWLQEAEKNLTEPAKIVDGKLIAPRWDCDAARIRSMEQFQPRHTGDSSANMNSESHQPGTPRQQEKEE